MGQVLQSSMAGDLYLSQNVEVSNSTGGKVTCSLSTWKVTGGAPAALYGGAIVLTAAITSIRQCQEGRPG